MYEAIQTAPARKSNPSTFHRLVDLIEHLVNELSEVEFASFYHVLPLATQLLGLENPLFGSGKSPYSIISVLSKLGREGLARWSFDSPLADRRALLDTLYDMTAPILLDEEEAFVELSVEMAGGDGDELRRELWEKLDRLRPLVKRLKTTRPGTFAHIAHYDSIEDLQREHAFLKELPAEMVEKWCGRSFPTVVELTFRGFSDGLPNITGWVLLISNSTEQLMNSNKLRKAKIMQCSKLAAELGAHTVGMAGLIAFFGNGGHVLSQAFPQMGFTTGHAYTIANVLEIAKESSARIGLSLPGATVAVVGAAGSIGSGCAKLFAGMGVMRLLLIDIWTERLDEVAAEVAQINPQVQIECFVDLKEMRRADLTVVATNSTRRLVESGYLKPGSIVIDDSFPKNVSESLTTDLKDVIALEGGAVRLPRSVEVDRARNLPNISDVPFTRMVSCQELYGCFAETLTLAVYDQKTNYGLGRSDPVLAVDIMAKANRLGIGMAPLQFYGQAVSEERIRNTTESRRRNVA